MSEEFDESDIIFSDNYFTSRRGEEGNEKENRPVGFIGNFERTRNNKPRRSKMTSLPAFSTSLPVTIPMQTYSSSEEDYSDEGRMKMVPPHLVAGRRMEGGQMAFSVCTGNGRTLKGRDLSRVRDSILRLTGFLEA